MLPGDGLLFACIGPVFRTLREQAAAANNPGQAAAPVPAAGGAGRAAVHQFPQHPLAAAVATEANQSDRWLALRFWIVLRIRPFGPAPGAAAGGRRLPGGQPSS